MNFEIGRRAYSFWRDHREGIKTLIYAVAIVGGVAAVIIYAGHSAYEHLKAQPRKTYQLQNGVVVRCRLSDFGPCGGYLCDCEDGLVYHCQQNVVELGVKP